MIYLIEDVLGFTLFKKQEDEVIKVGGYKFDSNDELIETYKLLNNNEMPKNLKEFLCNEFEEIDEVLAVRDDKLKRLIRSNCKILVENKMDENYKLFKNKFEDFIKEDYKKKVLLLSSKLALEKININSDKLDNMIVHSISLLIDIDKDINLHCMRIREWYGQHFPELSLLIDDNLMYLRLVLAIRNRNSCNLESLDFVDGDLSEKIYKLSINSMGADMDTVDLENIVKDCDSIVKNFEYRNNLSKYIKEKMNIIAPNITNLIGDYMGARLISKAGSLDTLSKYPASTIQLLGAEKSLFQALRNKSNTPKYGIIFESSLLGQVDLEYKGKIARSLAAKISLCAKIDASGKDKTGDFGLQSKNKIVNRIKHLKNTNKLVKKVVTKSKFTVNRSENYDDKNDIKRQKK